MEVRESDTVCDYVRMNERVSVVSVSVSVCVWEGEGE